jgi:urease accessory protein
VPVAKAPSPLPSPRKRGEGERRQPIEEYDVDRLPGCGDRVPSPRERGEGQGEGQSVDDGRGAKHQRDRRLLRLMTWLSPGFPTGAFAYSHGIEWAVAAGDVADPGTLRAWLTDLLRHGSGHNDAILLRQAYRAACDPVRLQEIAECAAALAPSRERRAETLDTGRAFAIAASAWSCPEFPADIAYPVAVGALAAGHGIPEDDAVLAYLQAFATNLISAAVRLIPLGQSAGLGVLAAIEPEILDAADATRDAGLDDIGGCVWRADLAAMRHETQYTRLFRS